MFTLAQIEGVQSKIKSAADFPYYVQDLKTLGVLVFETMVLDSSTIFHGADSFQVVSQPRYDALDVAANSNKEQFVHSLKIHQQGETDYLTFCRHCVECGIEKWVVDTNQLTCIYFDKAGNEILVEHIPSPV